MLFSHGLADSLVHFSDAYSLRGDDPLPVFLFPLQNGPRSDTQLALQASIEAPRIEKRRAAPRSLA